MTLELISGEIQKPTANGTVKYYPKTTKNSYTSHRALHTDFLVLSDVAEFTYKCTEFYHGEDESGIIWNDPDIGIDWPLEGIDEIILSDKDKKWMSFKDSKIKY